MLQTFARIEDGLEAESRVIRQGETLPDGDWRPVVVEGLGFNPATHREVGQRVTRIDADKVARVVQVEPLPLPSLEDYTAAIDAHIDATAKAKAYGGAISLASYVNSSVPQWKAEAEAFVAWRDGAWLAAYGIMTLVQAGQREPPTVAELIAALPPHPFT